jgi:hypothetical protein
VSGKAGAGTFGRSPALKSRFEIERRRERSAAFVFPPDLGQPPIGCPVT